jgi:hypothetical protein
MRVHVRSSVIAGLAIVGISALVMAPLPPQAHQAHQAHTAPTVAREVRLTAAPELGAIPFAFIRNQFEYCSVVCPYAVQGAITEPIASAQAPATFLGSLASTGSLLRAIGAAAASVTGPANTAATPIINNDLGLILPKAQHALSVAVVEAINVALSPGDFLNAVQTGRRRILGALNQPMGPPTTPTGARNILQVVAVETINVASAVLFQAGEMLLLGVVQTADAAAQELARSGDPAAALTAGATQAARVVGAAGERVTSAVNTAVTHISNSLADPFPSASTARTTAPKVEATTSVPPNRAEMKPDASGQKPDHKPTVGDGPDQSSATSSAVAASSTDGSSNDSATPSAKKNTMKSGPPR